MLIRKIYLSWRKGKGHKRHIVGVIKRSVTQTPTFVYLKENLNEALLAGFKDYPGFPDLDKVYKEDVLETFSLRVIPKERTDRNTYLKFWEADKISLDDFDLLALTQGWSPTDNFEFLGHYFPNKEFTFVTDIANLTKLKLPKDFVALNERLKFKLEKTNIYDYDKRAVKVVKLDGREVGYIKQIHCRPFFNSTPTITVKAIDQNGSIRQIFVSVQF